MSRILIALLFGGCTAASSEFVKQYDPRRTAEETPVMEAIDEAVRVCGPGKWRMVDAHEEELNEGKRRRLTFTYVCTKNISD